MDELAIINKFRNFIKEYGCVKATELIVEITCFILIKKLNFSPIAILHALPSHEIIEVEYQTINTPDRIKSLYYYKV